MRSDTVRLFDANLNRAREGLRVLEDTARFVLCSKKLCLPLRNVRHKAAFITQSIYPELVCGRDAQTDMGRKIKESSRKDIFSLAAANFRRVQEALRVLEEYSKILLPNSAREFKSLRFAVYTLEKRFINELNEFGKREKNDASVVTGSKRRKN